MMNNSNDVEIIDRFFKKELSEKELAEFNKRILQDNAFAEEVAGQMAIRESFKNIRRQEIKQILDQKAAAVNPARKKRILYAAACLLLFATFFLIFQSLKRPRLTEGERNQAIAEFEKDPALSVAGPGWRDLIKSNPDRALTLLDDQIAGRQNPCEDMELTYFAGMLHLYHSRKYRKAESYLSCALGETAKMSFRPDVPRHLTVAKALLGKPREAKELVDRYQVPAGELPPTIRRYLKLDADRK
jgi:hypothetical protein